LIRASPGLQSGGAGFQTRENALSSNDRALALVRMPQAGQSTRTFFLSSTTAGRRALLQSDRMGQLLVNVLAENRQKRRFLLHDFVIMPNHFHLLRRSRWKKHCNSSRAVLLSRETGSSFCF
jgi:putative transposase